MQRIQESHAIAKVTARCSVYMHAMDNFESHWLRFIVLLSDPTPIQPQVWGCSRCSRWPMLGSSRAEATSYSAVKLFPKYSNRCEKHTSTLQTDRQTDGHGITALCVASRDKKETKKTYFNSSGLTNTRMSCISLKKAPMANGLK